MAIDRRAVLAVPAAAVMLLWPAAWNGYPIVFADTGTYLSQAIHLYAGWDRPVFYSVFMLALHWTRTTWPVVIAQALLAAWMLWLTWRVLAPAPRIAGFLAVVAFLAIGTWLPWLVSELMPDLFTPLLLLAFCLLAWAPAEISRWERRSLSGLATFFIATQQSSVPLAAGILVLIGAVHAWRTLHRQRTASPRWSALLAPFALALLLLCSANLAAHHRFSLSPYGNVFLLARVLYDGPGQEALDRYCATEEWRLCAYRDRLPATSDDFLWTASSPLNLAGGPKQLSAEAGAIIQAALRTDPVGQLYASVANAWTQMREFDSGDGLQPWPDQVSPWIGRDFPPAEVAAYQVARQQSGLLAVPHWMAAMHTTIAMAGTLVSILMLAFRAIGRRARTIPDRDVPTRHARRSSRSAISARLAVPVSSFLLTILVALPLSAAITGALSAPHDRYQARIMWLPPYVAAAALRLRRGANAV